jgi:hypothetical protein
MTFLIPSRSTTGPHPKVVDCNVLRSGEVINRSTCFCRSAICGDSAADCFFPNGVKGASGTVVQRVEVVF